MPKICQTSLLCRRGCALARNWGSDSFLTGVCQRPHSRGTLPWEKSCDCTGNIARKSKRKIEKVQEKYCPYDCDVLKRPTRNTYEWVVEDGKPCKPFGFKDVVEKSVCEIRKFQKCAKIFGAGCPRCHDLAPNCQHLSKTYPMMEATQKGSLPGCPRPIPETSKNKQDK